ncbi:hypothetical protein KC686_02425 [Candidatus Woesebacteria bacterium]|nr:hypothetical protein [Candidatus Woesebacteria bacterium]
MFLFYVHFSSADFTKVVRFVSEDGASFPENSAACFEVFLRRHLKSNSLQLIAIIAGTHQESRSPYLEFKYILPKDNKEAE